MMTQNPVNESVILAHMMASNLTMTADNSSHSTSSYVEVTHLNNWTVSSTVSSMMNSTDNSTLNSTLSSTPVRNEQLAKVEVAVQAAIFFLAVFGNGMVLFVLCLRRKKLSRMNLMIVHLSIADLFVAFFNVLPQLIRDIVARMKGGDFTCRFIMYIQVVAMYASSYVLVSTAIDRYLAICHPLTTQMWSTRKSYILVGVAWAFSLAFSSPQLFIFAWEEVTEGSGVYDCMDHFHPAWTLNAYITWTTLAIYIIPFCILVVAYGRICLVVWKSMRAKEPSTRLAKRDMSNKADNGIPLNSRENGTTKHTSKSGNCNPRAHMRGMSNAKVKTVKLTLTVIICYLVCWGPFFIAQMWAAWDPNAPFEGKPNFD